MWKQSSTQDSSAVLNKAEGTTGKTPAADDLSPTATHKFQSTLTPTSAKGKKIGFLANSQLMSN